MLVRLFAPQRPKLKFIFEKKKLLHEVYSVDFSRVKHSVLLPLNALFFLLTIWELNVYTQHSGIPLYFHFALEFPHFMGHDTAIIAVIVKT